MLTSFRLSIDLNYQVIYNQLVQRGKERASTRTEANLLLNGYCEEHHIHPRCLGGDDAKENLVFLTAAEHFVAHQLLVKINPFISGLVFGLMLMSIDAKGHRINNKQYEWIKRRNSKARKGRTRDDCEWLAQMGDKLKGRTAKTHPSIAETAEKLSKIPKDLRAELVRKRDEEKLSFQELHFWLENKGIDIAFLSVAKIYKREKVRVNEPYTQIKMTNEFKEFLKTEYHLGKTYDELLATYIDIYFLKEFIFLKQYIKSTKMLSAKVKELLVQKVLETQSYKEVLVWAKEELGIIIPYSSLSALYTTAGYSMPVPVGEKRKKRDRKLSTEQVQKIIELKNSGLSFAKIKSILLEDGLDIPLSSLSGVYAEFKHKEE